MPVIIKIADKSESSDSAPAVEEGEFGINVNLEDIQLAELTPDLPDSAATNNLYHKPFIKVTDHSEPTDCILVNKNDALNRNLNVMYIEPGGLTCDPSDAATGKEMYYKLLTKAADKPEPTDHIPAVENGEIDTNADVADIQQARLTPNLLDGAAPKDIYYKPLIKATDQSERVDCIPVEKTDELNVDSSVRNIQPAGLGPDELDSAAEKNIYYKPLIKAADQSEPTGYIPAVENGEQDINAALADTEPVGLTSGEFDGDVSQEDLIASSSSPKCENSTSAFTIVTKSKPSKISILSSGVKKLGNRAIEKQFWPYYIFIGYIIFGLIVFGLAEKYMPFQKDARATSIHICIGSHGFGGLLFYVLSSVTTIGFGALYPCNLFTKIFGIFYALVGVPLALIILATIGEHTCKILVAIHAKIPPKIPPVDDPAGEAITESPPSDSDVPVSLGIGLILVFILLAAFYLRIVEHYRMVESVYYGFYTFILGDFTVGNFDYAIIMFIIVIVGLSMVASTYEIIQYNLTNLFLKVKRELKKHMNLVLTGEEEASTLEEKTPEEIVEKIIQENASPIQRSLALFDDARKNVLVHKAAILKEKIEISPKSKYTQTYAHDIFESADEDSTDLEDNNIYGHIRNKAIQTEDVPELRYREYAQKLAQTNDSCINTVDKASNAFIFLGLPRPVWRKGDLLAVPDDTLDLNW